MFEVRIHFVLFVFLVIEIYKSELSQMMDNIGLCAAIQVCSHAGTLLPLHLPQDEEELSGCHFNSDDEFVAAVDHFCWPKKATSPKKDFICSMTTGVSV